MHRCNQVPSLYGTGPRSTSRRIHRFPTGSETSQGQRQHPRCALCRGRLQGKQLGARGRGTRTGRGPAVSSSHVQPCPTVPRRGAAPGLAAPVRHRTSDGRVWIRHNTACADDPWHSPMPSEEWQLDCAATPKAEAPIIQFRGNLQAVDFSLAAITLPQKDIRYAKYVG